MKKLTKDNMISALKKGLSVDIKITEWDGEVNFAVLNPVDGTLKYNSDGLIQKVDQETFISLTDIEFLGLHRY